MDVYTFIRNRFPKLYAERDFSFAKHTTIGVGGRASVAVSPSTMEEACELICALNRDKIPYVYLGVGANSFASDERYDGVVIRFSRLNALYQDGLSVYAGAGVTGGTLVRFLKERLLGGCEFLTGIPLSVGGAVAMNAGVMEAHLQDVVDRVVAVVEGKICTLSNQECAFSVKNSVFLRKNIAILGVYLHTKYTYLHELERSLCYFRQKRAHLPQGRSMGCVFVNPAGLSAGALIEDCGLKGYRIGGVHVSTQHANFILNDGGTAHDVSSLIEYVQQRVKERTGIILRTEVRKLT